MIESATKKVGFSGGQDDNDIKSLKMRKDDFYKNLKLLLDDYINTQKINLKILFFGKQDNVQEKAIIKTPFFQKQNFVFSLKDTDLENSFCLKNLDNFSDENLHKVILENLNKEKINAIFIPLNVSENNDFNGLRLALHIRFTLTKNQCTTIFIYGTPNINQFLDNPYFDILKTKNVFYIDYNKKSLQEAENKPVDDFTENELSKEISKIKLTAPKDNHSIANEWAISRWAKIIHADNEDIRNIIQKIENNLYYKYLQTTFPISTNKDLLEELNIKYSNDDEYSNEQPKILYIDDEHEKGWNKIFTTIFNNTRFESLNIDFRSHKKQLFKKPLKKSKKILIQLF